MSPRLPSALDHWGAIAHQLGVSPFAAFLDYDGTLVPIQARPQDAIIADERREQVRRLASVHASAVVTGRAMPDIRRHVGLPTLHYAADHGFEIVGPDVAFEVDPALRPAFAQAAGDLTARIGDIGGIVIESKSYSVAVHYRLARIDDVPRIEAAIDAVVAAADGLRKGIGKKVFEVRPTLDWHKGAAVQWLLRHFGVEGSIYIGDDRTDEDALATVRACGGIGVIVGDPPWSTAAHYRVDDTAEVGKLLDALTSIG